MWAWNRSSRSDRGTPQLCVEVEPAAAEAAGPQDRNHREREFAHVGVELVGVPAEELVTGVRVDRTEQTVGDRELDLVLEGVAGERRVIGLDVELEVPVEAVGLEEGHAARDVEIVLVLGRFLRLGLDEELAPEPDRLRIIDRHVHERAEVVEFALQVRVEQRLVTLATAPEHVVLAAQRLGHVERLLHLGRGVGEDVRVGIGGRAAHVARMGKEVGRAPEQL